MYERYLSSTGVRVATATDGGEAVAMARTLRPDIVVMDLALPQLNGCEATRRLKRDPQTRDIPVLACAGRLSASSFDQTLDAGCGGYVMKPCPPEQLRTEMGAVLARLQRR